MEEINGWLCVMGDDKHQSVLCDGVIKAQWIICAVSSLIHKDSTHNAASRILYLHSGILKKAWKQLLML